MDRRDKSYRKKADRLKGYLKEVVDLRLTNIKLTRTLEVRGRGLAIITTSTTWLDDR